MVAFGAVGWDVVELWGGVGVGCVWVCSIERYNKLQIYWFETLSLLVCEDFVLHTVEGEFGRY